MNFYFLVKNFSQQWIFCLIPDFSCFDLIWFALRNLKLFTTSETFKNFINNARIRRFTILPIYDFTILQIYQFTILQIYDFTIFFSVLFSRFYLCNDPRLCSTFNLWQFSYQFLSISIVNTIWSKVSSENFSICQFLYFWCKIFFFFCRFLSFFIIKFL